ncbi:MAG: ribose 5-phosphate isomerase B [Bacillota bacterium]|nr:ribose 5-phosphate isomerase B [Bacillota bacterium]
MKVAIGADHGGFRLKGAIVEHLNAQGHEVIDFGTHSAESVDYPDIAFDVAQSVVRGEVSRGILVCGTGLGISIAANKVPGIIAAPVSDTFSAEMARRHNNANILALGERVIGVGLALKIVDTFLAAEFEGGRHQNRVEKIRRIEENR